MMQERIISFIFGFFCFPFVVAAWIAAFEFWQDYKMASRKHRWELQQWRDTSFDSAEVKQ